MKAVTIKCLLMFIYVSLLIFASGQANALGLMEAYRAAVANDSAYRAAIYEHEAGQKNRIIGRASLLPNISANYSYNKNDSDVSTSSRGFSSNENRNFNSENGAIQLRQPIVNLEGWARYRRGNLQADLSDKQLAASKQELIQRFFVLFSQANFAEDILALSIAERDAFKTQAAANEMMLASGEGTRTALIEAQAKLNLSEAQVIESKDGVEDGRNALAVIIGQEITSLDGLSDYFDVQPITPPDLEAWRTIALKNNPEIAMQQEAVALAYQTVKLNRAAHAPTLDVIARISKSESDTTATFNQEIDSKSIGLQLNIPIYSGGSVSALTSQAESNYQKAQQDLETKTNEVLLDLRKQYNTILSSKLKVEALKQSVASAELLIAATKKSLVGGIRTNIDVLNARKQLSEAKRDLSAARYNYLVAYINLKKAAGTLTVADIEKIAIHFSPKQ